MAVEAILGESVLNKEITCEAVAPTVRVEDLVAQHMQMVFRISWSILRNHHDAEDAVQECFLRVLKVQNTMHQVRNVRTWLARIAWTTALDRRSRRAVINGVHGREELLGDDSLSQLPDLSAPMERQLEERELQRILERLIARLPDELRQPLELSTVSELNSTEIAEIMKIPAESVRTRLHRARQLLKEKLAVLLEVKRHG